MSSPSLRLQAVQAESFTRYVSITSRYVWKTLFNAMFHDCRANEGADDGFLLSSPVFGKPLSWHGRPASQKVTHRKWHRGHPPPRRARRQASVLSSCLATPGRHHERGFGEETLRSTRNKGVAYERKRAGCMLGTVQLARSRQQARGTQRGGRVGRAVLPVLYR